MKKMTHSHSAFDIYHPLSLETAVVFASPHSGRDYSASFLHQSILDSHTIRSSEDAFVDQLADFVTEFGAPFLCAKVPRAYLDLNRSHDELDPAVVDGAKTKGHNARIASGLGVIPRVVSHSRPIYRGKISMHDAQHRLTTYWHPYHDALQGLMDQAVQKFGYALLVDLHSMPHDAVASPSKFVEPTQIVLGDRFGASCDKDLGDHVYDSLVHAGFRVGRNSPFAGAFITHHYGRPSQRYHAIQIEIDRGLYLHESEITLNDGFPETREKLRVALERIATYCADQSKLAAE